MFSDGFSHSSCHHRVLAMDLILEAFDGAMLDSIYARLLQSQPLKPVAINFWARDSVWRQALSLYVLTWFVKSRPDLFLYLTCYRTFGTLIYLVCASFSYVFVYDKGNMQHSKFLKNQVRLEIGQALESTPIIALFTAPIFLLEVRGYSRLYGSTADGPGIWYDFAQFPLFLLFTDFGIYLIHRF